jgi:hypothetical protein
MPFTPAFNDLFFTLASGYTPGSGVLALTNLNGLPGGVPSLSVPIRLSIDRVRDGAKSIVIATGISGASTLTGVSVAEGKTDIAFDAGDVAKIRLSAGYINDLEQAVSSLSSPAVFHPSGSTHSSGLVPDPGSTPGTTKYLREDATWVSPAGGVTSVAGREGDVVLANTDISGLGTASTHPATDFLTPTGSGSGLTGITNTQVSGLGTASTHPSTDFLTPTGSGASLTGITNTQISGLGTASTHPATDFLTPTGSGAGLTGIPESAVTNLTSDLAAKLTSNQTITLSGNVTGSGSTAITTAIGSSQVTNAMLAGSIAASKLIGTDIVLAGSQITSGTVAAARLPVFVASGTSHATGVVPDPGATAGTTHFLREDATWQTPSTGITIGTTTITGGNPGRILFEGSTGAVVSDSYGLTYTTGNVTLSTGNLVVNNGNISCPGLASVYYSERFGAGSACSNQSVAFGYQASVLSNHSVGIGSQVSIQVGADSSICIGDSSGTVSTNCVVIGSGASTIGASSTVVGASAKGGTAFGTLVNATGGGVGVGANVDATGSYSCVIGTYCNSTASGGVCLGYSATANYSWSIALGFGTTTTASNQLMLGTGTSRIEEIVFGSLNPHIYFQGYSSTYAYHTIGIVRSGYTVNTDASFTGYAALCAYDYTGTEREGIRVTSNGSATQVGMFGTTPVAKQVVTGSKSSGAALISLLSALSNLGLITDSTTS